MNIEELNLSVRAYNVLKRAGINTVEQICEHSGWELSLVRNMGNKTLLEIKEKVLAAGYDAFGMKAPPPSNGNKLRHSSDEELAAFILGCIYGINAYDGRVFLNGVSVEVNEESILQWLHTQVTDRTVEPSDLPY